MAAILNNRKQDKALWVIGLFLLIPAVYSYSLASDSRYLFSLYPLFSIAAIYTIKKIFEQFHREKILSVIIISSFIVISVYYLNLKDVDVDHELEAYEMAQLIADRVEGTYQYNSESGYLSLVKLNQINEFPANSDEYEGAGPVRIFRATFSTMDEYIEHGRIHGVTDLILDGGDRSPKLFNDIFYEKEKYSFLIEEFNSKDYDYNYIVKIYRIDFKEFDRLKIEN